MRTLFAALGLLLCLSFVAPGSAVAAPEDDMSVANAIVERALAAAKAGDLATALREYKGFENRWFEVEDGVRERSREAYRVIEKHMSSADTALAAKKQDEAITALTALNEEVKRFVAGQPPAQASSSATTAASASNEDSTITLLLQRLRETRSALAAGNYEAATAAFERFSDVWLDVEGEVKTRSAGDYRAIENDMARVSTQLSQRSTGAAPVLDSLEARIRPYENAGDYKVFDATIIVLREGLEALLVVVALLAFVKRSANGDKSGWIWGGAAAGLVVSIVLGLAIHFTLGKAFSGDKRELMEGLSGLFAAAMLLYVSYWLHSKASLGAWQRYISGRTTQALASGSLLGLGLLSFLAVFREGGETVLFLIGMTGRISTPDLVLGLGIGAVALAVVGVLLTVVGIRIPMRPFFAVASVLTFYLCFKFLGTGIHALQVADIVSAHTSESLPSNDTLGLFPTWQTTVPQVVLLLAGLSVMAYGRISDIAFQRARATTPSTADS